MFWKRKECECESEIATLKERVSYITEKYNTVIGQMRDVQNDMKDYWNREQSIDDQIRDRIRGIDFAKEFVTHLNALQLKKGGE